MFGMAPYGNGCGTDLRFLVGEVPTVIGPSIPPFGGLPPPPMAGNGCGPYYPPGCSPCPPGGNGNVAAVRQALYQMQCEAQAAQFRRAARAVAVGHMPGMPLGVSSATIAGGPLIAAGATAVIRTTPRITVCLVRFSVSRASAPLFTIGSINAAQQELLADGNVPADFFATDSEQAGLIDEPWLAAGTPVDVTVTNISAAPARFDAAFKVLRASQPSPCLG